MQPTGRLRDLADRFRRGGGMVGVPRCASFEFPMFSVGWTWQGFCRDSDPCTILYVEAVDSLLHLIMACGF